MAQLGRLSRHNVLPVERSESIPIAIANVPAATAEVQELSKTMTEAELRAALRTLVIAWPNVDTSSDEHIALGKASAELCRSCQQSGHMDLAQEVLRLAVKSGHLDAATYFAHEPIPVVLSLAPLEILRSKADDVVVDAASGEPNAEASLDASVERLRDAASLFLPTSPALSYTEAELPRKLFRAAKKLIECALAARDHDLVKSIYASIVPCIGDKPKFAKWYKFKVQESGDPALMVSSFVMQPPAADTVSKHAFFALGDRIVEATRLSHYVQAGPVFETLTALAAATSNRLRTLWVTDLLYGQWQATRDFSAVQTLFKLNTQNSSEAAGVAAATYHADGAYRVMMQIALDAGRHAEAEALLAELTALKPSAAHDIRVIGLFALAKAKAGDWQGVQDDFQQAVAAAGAKGLNARDAERVFVPIAKEHVRTHTIGETEDFLKTYVEEIGVPLGRYMVTLLANEYGALREVRSFVAWLEYCAQAGFVIDAAFSNAILQSCRKHWKFGFRDLRTMYRKLRLLSPNFEDSVTLTIMTHAAVANAKSIARPDNVKNAKSRVLSLRINTAAAAAAAAGDKAPTAPTAPTATTATAAASTSAAGATPAKAAKGFMAPVSTTTTTSNTTITTTATISNNRHFLNEDDLYVAMRQAFATGMPAKVVRMYKHAMRGGMPSSTKCLKLAVGAAVKIGRLPPAQDAAHANDHMFFDPSTAIDLIETARAAGHDIDGAASYLVIAYIDAASPQSVHGGGSSSSSTKRQIPKKARVAAAVKSILLRLSACGVEMSDLALNRAAFHMYKAGHMSGAIALALSAADLPVGGGRPGYNVWNYSVLIAAYARNADATGIRTATEGAAANGVLRELRARKVLKQARNRLRQSHLDAECAVQESSAGSSAESSAHYHQSAAAVQQTRAQHLEEALRAVEDALEQVRAARQQLIAERRQVEQATMRIMQQAAAAMAEAHAKEDGSSSISSGGSNWDLLDMPIDEDGRLIDRQVAAPPLSAVGAC